MTTTHVNGDASIDATENRQEAAVVGTTPPPGRGLLDHDWQRALIVELAILAGLALLWVSWQVISPLLHTIMLFALGAVLAFALTVPVDALRSRIGNRAAAIAAIYLVVGVVVIGGLALLAGPFAVQASALLTDLPRYASELQTRVPQLQSTLAGYGLQTDINAGASTALEQGGTEVLKQLLTKVAELGGLVFDALLVLVISVYFVGDGARLRQRSLALMPASQRGRALFVEENVARVLGGYLRGQLALAAIIGVATGIGMSLLGVPYAVVLGVLAGLLELVPMFGPILSAVPALLVALFLPFPTIIWVLLFFLGIQQVENNVLAPRISGHAVGLHPLGAMFALLAGFQLAGVIGGLFAVPIAGVLWVLIGAAYRNAVVAPRQERGWTLPRLRSRAPNQTSSGPPRR